MRIVYFGSPAISADLLKALLADGRHEVVCVVSNVDKPRGRSKKLHPTAVSAVALEYGLPLYRFEKLSRNDAAVESLAGFQADLFVVFAYGHWIPGRIFDLPPMRTINLHASLLPLLRGASPIQSALWNGFSTTGWSIQFVGREMDAGDVLSECRLPVDPNVTAAELTEQMLPAGIQLMVDTLAEFETLAPTAKAQRHELATHCSKIQTSDTWLDWDRPAVELHNQIRALNPAPGARTVLEGDELKIWRTQLVPAGEWGPEWREQPPGTFGPGLSKKHLFVRTGDGLLAVLELQPRGRKQLTAQDFLNGYRAG
ncbi:MAG: methionyl-tRNA formyltransferase, partial [Leptospiraceae bacterium]|nr:methionyl-tRNA formyltransferase [Leptospiraceae bacterium]